MLLAVSSLNEDAVNKHVQILHMLQNSKAVTEWYSERTAVLSVCLARYICKVVSGAPLLCRLSYNDMVL